MLHTPPVEAFHSFIEREQRRFLAELTEWLRIPSISSLPDHKNDLARCAQHLAQSLAPLHPDRVEIWPTPRHPAVFASWNQAPGQPTVLIYGHHDVQPVDPISEWASPPFEATVRDGRLYARGATDDKGQVWMHLKAIETLQRCLGRLPINLSLIVEGEEEVGSENLIGLFREHSKDLEADVVCVSDTDMFQPGVPSICVMMRGLAYFEIRLQSASGDLHSGSFGGAVLNAATALSRLLAELHTRDGRIAIQGFYDDVRAVSEAERAAIRTLPFDAHIFRQQAAGAPDFGEQGFSPLERLWIRPSLDINGITAGFQGPGSKTVIPSVASAKLSFRLVADQDPARVESLLRAHLARACPEGVQLELTTLHSGFPYRAPVDKPVFSLAKKALERAFGRPAVFVGEGGSIPFIRQISDATGKPCLLLGFGLPEGNAHAPNEWLSLDNFRKGIESIALLYEELGRTNPR
ncbi:MAG: dipeptidase [Deltaproteobacteria bacterium]|nr:dipeptidase [Deltaproteobacteria bacterium]